MFDLQLKVWQISLPNQNYISNEANIIIDLIALYSSCMALSNGLHSTLLAQRSPQSVHFRVVYVVQIPQSVVSLGQLKFE